MIFSGIEGSKVVNIDYSFLKKSWKLTKKRGKNIYVIPSDRVFVGSFPIEEGIKNEKQLEKFLKLRYADYLFDFSADFEKKRYTLVLVRDFLPPSDAFALDAEIFALARLKNLTEDQDLAILDLGRRKTTLVVPSEGDIPLYRVILKGGDFITQKVAESLNLSFDEAERLKLERGLELKPVREALKEILKGLPPLGNRSVLLSGGGASLKGIEEFFSKRASLKVGLGPVFFPALGAALKFVYPDKSPRFTKRGIDPKEFKLYLYGGAISILAFFVALSFMKGEVENYIKLVKEREAYLFHQKFPSLPTVAVVEQLKTFQEKERPSVLPLFEKLIGKLPPGFKIYKIDYLGGVLKIKGETDGEGLKKLNPASMKEIGNNRYLVEVEVK